MLLEGVSELYLARAVHLPKDMVRVNDQRKHKEYYYCSPPCLMWRPFDTWHCAFGSYKHFRNTFIKV